MELSKSEMAALLGKHPGSVYRELSRNGTGGVYTGSDAQRAAEQRRLDGKPSPQLDCPALTEKILDMFYFSKGMTCHRTRFRTDLGDCTPDW
jgi:IS30 family transposase